jgi:hypothetical protein
MPTPWSPRISGSSFSTDQKVGTMAYCPSSYFFKIEYFPTPPSSYRSYGAYLGSPPLKLESDNRRCVKTHKSSVRSVEQPYLYLGDSEPSAVGLVGKLTEGTTPWEQEINVSIGGEVSLLICNANALVTPDQRFLLRHGSKSVYHGPLSELLFLQNTIVSHSAKFLVLVRSIATISTSETQIRQQTMRENS